MLWLLLAIGAPSRVVADPIPPAPTQWVTDTSGFLSPSVAQTLNARLRDCQQSTGHQAYVWIGKSTGGDTIEEWAARTFQAWRVGRKGYDDGVVLFVMSSDHTARIEVGYGLEGQIPDAVASRIVEDELIPRIRAGDHDGAITAAVDKLVSALGATSTQPVAWTPSAPQIVVMIILGIILVALAARHPMLAYFLLRLLTSIAGRGVDGGPDARGGGGRSGGGGASGRW